MEGALWLQRPPAPTNSKPSNKWEQVSNARLDPQRPYPLLSLRGSGDPPPLLELTVVRCGPVEEAIDATAAADRASSTSSSSWLRSLARGAGPTTKGKGTPAAPTSAVWIYALDHREWVKAQQYGLTPAPPRRFRLGWASREEAAAWGAALASAPAPLPAPTPVVRTQPAPPPHPHPADAAAVSSSATPPLPLPLSLPLPPVGCGGVRGGGGQGGDLDLERRLERLQQGMHESRLNGLRVRLIFVVAYLTLHLYT